MSKCWNDAPVPTVLRHDPVRARADLKHLTRLIEHYEFNGLSSVEVRFRQTPGRRLGILYPKVRGHPRSQEQKHGARRHIGYPFYFVFCVYGLNQGTIQTSLGTTPRFDTTSLRVLCSLSLSRVRHVFYMEVSLSSLCVERTVFTLRGCCIHLPPLPSD